VGEAVAAYQEAADALRETGGASATLLGLALRVKASQAQGDLTGAMTVVEEILAESDDGSLAGVRNLHRTYLVCYRVLHAVGDPRAEAVLKTAHRLLQEVAGKITDQRLRSSFLKNVPDHREIVAQFARLAQS
jgi:hypothetical protein